MDKEEAFRLLLLILVHESTMKIYHANYVILIGKVLQAWNYESNIVVMLSLFHVVDSSRRE